MFRNRNRLLSLLKRKLTHCWDAAQWNEKCFRSRYSRNDIASMSLEHDCDLVLDNIEMDKEDGAGININIYSKLLYGLTMISRYQADILFDNARKLLEETVTDSPKGRRRRRNRDETAEAIQAETAQIDLPPEPRDIRTRTDLNLMLDEVPSIPNYEEMELERAARLDFGILADVEFEILFSSDDFGELWEEMRRDETVVSYEPSATSINVTGHRTVHFHEETSALEPLSEHALEQEVQPPEAFDPAAEVTVSHADIAIPEVSMQELQVQGTLPQAPEQVVFEKPMRRARGKIKIDKTTMLSGITIQKQTQDCRIHTESISIPFARVESAKELLSRPGSSIPCVVNGTWGERLTSLFKEIIAQPIVPLTEPPAATVSEINADDAEIMQHQPEVMRQIGEETLADNVQESSTAMPAGQQTDFSMSKAAHSTMITVPPEQMPEDSRKDTDDEPTFIYGLNEPQLPDITDETIIVQNRKRPTISEHDRKELLETIELYQRKQNPVPFNKMAHELNYNRNVVVDQFLNLLILHLLGIVSLAQTGQLEEIWIIVLPNSGRHSTP